MSDIVLSTAWHSRSSRKLEAVRAASERDLDKLLDLVNTYLTYWGRKRLATAQRTRSTYKTGIVGFFEYIWPEGGAPDPHPLRITDDDVALWIAKMQFDKKQPKTVQTYVSSVRTLYKALVWAGALERNPLSGVTVQGDPTPGNVKHPPVPARLYDEMVDSLADETDAVSRRDLVLLLLFGDAGYRLGDVVRADVADMDLKQGIGNIHGGKGGKDAEQQLGDTLVQALFSYLGVHDAYAAKDEVALLVNFGPKVRKGYVGKRMGRSGIEGVLSRRYQAVGLPERYQNSHALRKRAVTNFKEATGDLGLAQEFARHSSSSTTILYIGKNQVSVRRGVEAVEEARRRRRDERDEAA